MYLTVLLLVLSSAAGEYGNTSLLVEILGSCRREPTFRCVQEGFTGYLEGSLKADRLPLTEGIVFTRNENKYQEVRHSRSDPERENSLNVLVDRLEEVEGLRDTTVKRSIAGVADLLYDKTLGYLVTHDLRLSLPSYLFGRSALDIMPQSIEEDGSALVRIKFADQTDLDPPQQQGRILFKKIKQLLKRKLLTGFLAALLIVALLKVKLLFFAPLLLGVTTAKKLLLKVLLFLFPALAHLFKLCAYYHHHHSKYHLHHHHQVAHHHHHVPVPIHPPVYNHAEEGVYPEEPPGPVYGHPGGGGGPYHRSSEPNPFPSGVDNDLTSWGIESPPLATQYQANNDLARVWNPPSTTKKSHQVEVLGAEWDPFYSPILTSVDDVFTSLGFIAEGCRERLVCSMYKAPQRFSPHSNLISNQLSRDPSELQRPSYSNRAVSRFYSYVEAARHGQDGKDCLALYPSCAVVTE